MNSQEAAKRFELLDKLNNMKITAKTKEMSGQLNLPQSYSSYGLLDIDTGKVFLFAHVIERLNMTLGQFGYEVSAKLDSIDALTALVQLENAIEERDALTSEDAFYDLV